MAKARAIVKRLKAVKNIRKITRTMELIATARFKKAMDRASEAAAYTKKISELVADLSQANLEFHHPLLEKHESEQNSVLLILTSNRGLCGGYNSGVLKLALKRYQELKAEGQNIRLEVSGKRGIGFLKFQDIAAAETYTHFEDRPTFEEVDQLATRFITEYIEGKIDRLDVAYTEFVSSSKQQPVVQSLLPIGALESSTEASETSQKYDYEFLPSAQEILEEIVPTAFKARLFKCFLDAAVSEQIARMVAMKGATENANEMVGTLSAQYNRARQTQITSEILEIIGGAAALE
ncbi:ATP synthase F1 subunit gamma [Gimesia fumaroli]|uniref:ATP synthase gamma chain n=1 Tax=Gimesia fumaroli TaxID=2527976 RepID=A0A518IDE2_9PLAN|nr:ATP synthase F1 subunit gamma [Gimesia fumaroli]QDV51122.1 ATP synthase gamma chain [Gimesia fumaroli]